MRVNARTEAEQRLIDELARLRQEHNWFYGRLHGLGPSGHSDTPSEAERATLREGVDNRERRITHLHQRLSLLHEASGLDAPGATELLTSLPSPPQLEDGTLLLEYAFTSEIGAAFVLSTGGLSVVPLDLGTRKLRQLLTRWQLNVESAAHALRADRPLEPLRANALGHLSGLYQALIAPVAAHLEGVERLIVVPFGPAHGVPFHALFDGARHLIERTDVWTSPSSSLFELCAQRVAPTTSEALVMGYSGGRLPFILDEARSVSRLLGGSCYLEEKATRAMVMAEASHRSIVHLAAHGEARLDNPAFAHLSLADGQLEMSDVLTLRLDGALVTLSGCETGRSAVVGGDELIGLSRGFLLRAPRLWCKACGGLTTLRPGSLCSSSTRALPRSRAWASLRQAQRAFGRRTAPVCLGTLPTRRLRRSGAALGRTHPQEVHVMPTTGVENPILSHTSSTTCPDEVCVLVRADEGIDPAQVYDDVRTALNGALAGARQRPCAGLRGDLVAEDLEPSALLRSFRAGQEVLQRLGASQPWLLVPAAPTSPTGTSITSSDPIGRSCSRRRATAADARRASELSIR